MYKDNAANSLKNRAAAGATRLPSERSIPGPKTTRTARRPDVVAASAARRRMNGTGCGELEVDPGYGCLPDHDSVLCWPWTRPSSLAVQPCFEEFNGLKYDSSQNASRLCGPTGVWEGYTNYSQCRVLLPSVPEIDNSAEITTYIYLAGYGLSLLFLVVAVVIYLYYRELRCLRNIIHTNLMFTYILADFLWILFSVSQISLDSNIAMCAIFYTLYHYFQLTNFFWMFVEGLYLYVLVVKTFSGDHIKLRTCLLVGWGIPFLVMVVWEIARSLIKDEGNVGEQDAALSRHCPWMVSHTFDWIYQVPAISVLCVNIVFLFMIMWVLITKLRSANNAETQQYRKAAKALLVLIPLLGATYILVLRGPSEGQAANIFGFIRAILLSCQGLWVALFYCCFNGEVRNALRHHYERWSTERSLGAGQRDYAHWAPRSRTESIRLYCRPAAAAVGVSRAAGNNGCGGVGGGGGRGGGGGGGGGDRPPLARESAIERGLRLSHSSASVIDLEEPSPSPKSDRGENGLC